MYNVNHDEILEEMLDINPKIRFAAVYYKGEYYTKMREGLKPFLNKEETEVSMSQATVRMISRNLLAHKAGGIRYALEKYNLMCRITILFGKNGLIFFTTESDAEYDMIAEKIFKLRKKFEDLLDKRNAFDTN